ERAIKHGKVAHHHGKKAEACARFQNGQRACGGAPRSDVAKTESKKIRSAHVEVRLKTGVPRHVAEGAADRKIDEPEADDHSAGPHHKQKHERERAVVAERGFTLARGSDAAGKKSPRPPRGDVEKAREAEAAGGAAWQNDGLEGVEQHDPNAGDAGRKCQDVHRVSFRREQSRGAPGPLVPCILLRRWCDGAPSSANSAESDPHFSQPVSIIRSG